MNRVRRNRLITLAAIMTILSVATLLILYALRQNISLFYTPSEVIQGLAPIHQQVRVGGMVVKNSVVRDKSGLGVKFKITDYQQTLTVDYQGILPDLFREGQGIVTLGELNDQGQFKANQVLAKHDENYMPPEVRDALKGSGETG